jgi:hypothetical protein
MSEVYIIGNDMEFSYNTECREYALFTNGSYILGSAPIDLMVPIDQDIEFYFKVNMVILLNRLEVI